MSSSFSITIIVFVCIYSLLNPISTWLRADHLGLGLFLRKTDPISQQLWIAQVELKPSEPSLIYGEMLSDVHFCNFFAGNTKLVSSLYLSRSYYFVAILLVPCLLQSLVLRLVIYL